MKKILIALTLVLSLAVSAMGCSLAESAVSLDVNDYFSKRDLAGEWKESKATAITLSESVTISTEGTYILSGTLADGTITVNAGKDDKVQLVLNGVNVTSSSSAALLVENAGKVFVTLADGTENFLTSTGFDESSDIDAAVYAKDDIVFNGTGSLTVTSAKHGILGKDDVKFASGTYIITTQGRGIDAKDGIAIADGSFTIEGVKKGNALSVWHDGFYQRLVYVNDVQASDLRIYMVEESSTRYNETKVTPFATTQGDGATSSMTNINRKDFARGSLSVDNALKGEVAGLQVTEKSGMTGEGAFMQLRGVRSLVADNAPLVVINGVPYMPDANLSQIIGGYSRSYFQALNNLDIRNITVLKGAEAAAYGSMGSNGVIMIETDQASSSDMNTRISFSAIAGVNWNSKRVPLMNSSEYKNFLSDMGLTYYPNMEAFFNDFNFMSDPQANKSYLYQYDTDWQDEIYRNSTTMDYLFRVEGGDNIAKYNISLGYMGDQGTMKNTHSDRYNAQINASVLVSKNFEIRANINTAYLKGQYQEQGLSKETNPILAAYRRAPLLSPYQSDMYGNLINKYSSYWFGAIHNEDFIVSNPVSLVNNMMGKNRQYDMNLKLHLIYSPIRNLTLNGIVGMYYNYNQEEAFIPGIDNEDIVPLFDQYGQANNTIRVGTNHTFNMFYNVNAAYKLNIGETHKVNLNAGWQAVTTSYEYDAGFGRNSNNDFFGKILLWLRQQVELDGHLRTRRLDLDEPPQGGAYRFFRWFLIHRQGCYKNVALSCRRRGVHG